MQMKYLTALQCLLQKDNNSFWKSWNNKINNNKFIDTPVNVNIKRDPADIASEFKECFADIYIKS